MGDLGPSVDRFLDWAQAACQSLWQVLPVGPPETYNSPYSCLSAFAGNPLLISPELLRSDGLLHLGDLPAQVGPAGARVDFGAAIPWKEAVLEKAWKRFKGGAGGPLGRELEAFRAAPEQALWLEDWALFSALREEHRQAPWWSWPRELAHRAPAALRAFRERRRERLSYHRFLQFLFFRQWRRVRLEAARRGIALLGDLPIYVARNSADVWARPELFQLDDEGRPLAVAGVPPDDYAETGQLWGNPLYRWEKMAEDGYSWWIERVAANLRLADSLRFDHFRGFLAYWSVDADAATAEDGRWVPGPGADLFVALEKSLGGLPLVAENLGVITPDVEELRRSLGLPGMAVLHFGFGEDRASREHLPHLHVPATVVYTGTHDNETTRGWFENLEAEDRRRVETYTGAGVEDIAWSLIRLAYASVANVVVIPLQDVLGLGSGARMNTPGTSGGNWEWRLEAHALTPALARQLADLASLTDRVLA